MLLAQATTTTSTATLVGWGIGVLIWIGVIVWTVSIAKKKGRSAAGWGALAFFFSWIALLVVAVLPSRSAV